MKIVCYKDKILKALNSVVKGVASKTTMPILEGILIQTNDNEVKLTTYDLEIGIEYVMECEVKEQGSTVVNAVMFSEIVRKLPDTEISISLNDKNLLEIECEGSLYKLATMNPEEFPELPKIEVENSIEVSQNVLKTMIRKTIFAVSNEESRPIFTGCLFEVENNKLTLVAVDGFRLALRRVFLNKQSNNFKAVIPGKTLNEVSKIISGGTDDEVRLYFTENHVLFEFDDTIVVSRLIEGEYFRIDQMLNSDYDTKLTVNKKEMLSCIDRTTMLIKDSDKKPIIIGITDHSMEVKLNSAYGSMKEELAIDKRGKDIMIGFNPKFLIDALRVIDDEMINIYMINPKAPCFIRNDEGTYIYLILPVNFNVY